MHRNRGAGIARESLSDLVWASELSPRMRWLLPHGCSLRHEIIDKAELGPGSHFTTTVSPKAPVNDSLRNKKNKTDSNS